MVNISYNFPQNNRIDLCCCGEEDTMEHVYNCTTMNNKESNIPYNRIYNGNIGEQVEIFRRFQRNMKKENKEKFRTKKQQQTSMRSRNVIHCTIILYSNGFNNKKNCLC